MQNGQRFDKFTERARKVLSLAQEEAQRFNHTYIGTEHLLLGLVREGDGVAGKVLSSLGVELDNVRSAVESRSERSDRIVLGSIELTLAANRALELAVDEAHQLNHEYIGTEHILLGLVREGEGIAAQVLESFGVNVETARTHTLQILNQSGGHPANSPRPRSSKTPTLDQMGIDLAAQARQGRLAPVIGHDKDIMRVIQVLSRSHRTRTGIRKNNIVLISEPELGLRKIAIVEGLAQRIVSPVVPSVASGSEALEPTWLSLSLEKLQGKRLVTLEVGLLVAGTNTQSEIEERFKTIIEEIRSSQDCIIVIDELRMLLGAGGAEGGADVAPLLVPALARGEIQCIGAMTLDEFRTFIEKDPELQHHFQEVIVHEVITDETILTPSSGGTGGSGSTEREKERFDTLTERFRKVMSLALEEAQGFNHNYIGTEHLLLGLVREGDGVAAQVLLGLGVELNKVRSAVEYIIGRGDRIVPGEIGLTPRSKKVIELAVDEARRLNHQYIGTEHLLLGLVREGEGIAAGVLESLGVSLVKVRTQTIQVLHQGSGDSEVGGTSGPRSSPNTWSIPALSIERLTHIQAEMQQTFRLGDRDPNEPLETAQQRAYSLARSMSELLAEIARLHQELRASGEPQS